MAFGRKSGLLLHPTSLTGAYGIGTLGKAAYEWVDLLADAQQRLWQILPLGPTGFGDSPYQCYSAFAGNPLLIDLDLLCAQGWLEPEELGAEIFGAEDARKVDYSKVRAHKLPLIERAFKRFCENAGAMEALDAFCAANAAWLDDYALFMALQEQYPGKSWTEWPREIRLRQSNALTTKRQQLRQPILLHRFMQYLFFDQWMALKAYANKRNVRIIGDIPIYVSGDSADVWTHPHYFVLDADLLPTHVAGVPPDYFSETGQRWGNPLFDWKALETHQFDWWIERIRASLTLYDITRIDHFRGFEAYWAIPASEETALLGEWLSGPEHALFEAIEKALGHLPLIAEDLGIITPEVEKLRDDFNLPGMKILQFAFGGDSGNVYLPHHYAKNSVVYTGTHDNDTLAGWIKSLPYDSRELLHAKAYLDADDLALHWALIRAALASAADTAIIPFQDILNLDSRSRMNTPGIAEGNWQWRYTHDDIDPKALKRLASMTELYGRLR